MTNKIMETAFVSEWSKRLGKNKKWYFAGSLMFGGGKSVNFKMWDRGAEKNEPPLPDKGFFNVTGSYDDRGQFILDNFTPFTGNTSGMNFSPMPPFGINVEELNREFCILIQEIKTDWLRSLVIDCITNLENLPHGYHIPEKIESVGIQALTNEETAREMRYYSMWAATFYHHAYKHGWLIHTIEVTRAALSLFESMVRGYCINEQAFGNIREQRELVIAGALMHDIGKAIENFSSGIVHEKTSYGRFMEGDLDITADYIQHIFSRFGYDQRAGFSKHMWVHFLKVIRAHHGFYGTQSPITFAAQCVQNADSATSHMAKLRKAFLEGDMTPSIRKNDKNKTYFSYAAKVV